MASFSAGGTTVNFTTDTASWSEAATSSVTVRGFPGGDKVAISLGGQREVLRTVTCVFPTRGDWINFIVQRGRVGSLYIDGWDTGSVGAILKEANPDAPLANGEVHARAQFVLT